MVSVGLNDNHRKAREALKMQDCMYTVAARDPSGVSHLRVIGSILDVLQAPDENSQVIDLIASPSTKMVTLTIKEGNYFMNDQYTRFDTSSPLVTYDLITATVPSRPPRTPIGILVAGLHKRFLSKPSSKPLTVLCCDNFIRGGEITRVAVESFALHRFPLDTSFHQWLSANVFYPNTVCDRICLTDPSEDRIAIQQIAGIRDDALLTTETYSKWYIEKWMGAKPEGLADIEGVEMVSNTHGYENLKIRVNYGSRLAVAMVAHAMGLSNFEEALTKKSIKSFMHAFMAEAQLGLGTKIPTDIEIEKYKSELVRRVSTPGLKYMPHRVVEDSFHKVKMDWKPVVNDMPAEGCETKAMAFAMAVWAHVLAGSGLIQKTQWWHPMPGVLEPLAKNLVGSSSTGNVDSATRAFLERVLGNPELVEKNGLKSSFVTAMKTIDKVGIAGAVDKLFV